MTLLGFIVQQHAVAAYPRIVLSLQ